MLRTAGMQQLHIVREDKQERRAEGPCNTQPELLVIIVPGACHTPNKQPAKTLL